MKLKRIISLIESLNPEELKLLSFYLNESIGEEQLKKIADKIGFEGDLNQLNRGIEIEMEHMDTVKGDLIKIAMIAKDHLDEFPDYYIYLDKMEEELKRKHGKDKIETNSELDSLLNNISQSEKTIKTLSAIPSEENKEKINRENEKIKKYKERLKDFELNETK